MGWTKWNVTPDLIASALGAVAPDHLEKSAAAYAVEHKIKPRTAAEAKPSPTEQEVDRAAPGRPGSQGNSGVRTVSSAENCW